MNERIDTILGYLAAGLGFVAQCDWMGVGAAVLLISRLIVDVPRAYNMIKRFKHGKGD